MNKRLLLNKQLVPSSVLASGSGFVCFRGWGHAFTTSFLDQVSNFLWDFGGVTLLIGSLCLRRSSATLQGDRPSWFELVLLGGRAVPEGF